MGINVREIDRDQQFLMPPSVADWLPEGHMVWFVLDVVAELDLSSFYATLREDGRGGAAYDPAVLLAVLLYAYCVGERSSRRIEARLVEDIAFRVIAANQRPDHATLARFRRGHQRAIAELFSQVLGLCVAAGLVDAGLVAIDGTKMGANASAWSNRTRRQLAEEILAEAEQFDAVEDEQLGEHRGDELPGEWADRRDRRARVREALRQLDAEGAADWESYLAERAAKEATLGRKLGGRKPSREGRRGKSRHANVTDPDSRMLKARQAFVQGYNAQAAVTGEHVVVAAEVTNAANDTTQLEPMLTATGANLEAAGYDDRIGTVVADAGYWSTDNATIDTDAELLIATVAATNRATDPDGPRIEERRAVLERLDRGELSIAAAGREMRVSPTWTRQLLAAHRERGPDPALVRAAMDAKLASPHGAALYARRKTTVEPVFGDIKTNRGYRSFARRGLHAVASEWKLICAAHNIRKLWRHHQAALALAH
jgi:transposase